MGSKMEMTVKSYASNYVSRHVGLEQKHVFLTEATAEWV